MEPYALTGALRIGATAFLIALTGAMAPGPLLTVSIEHTIRRGGPSAMMLLVGHALLEAALLVGLAFGLRRVLVSPGVTVALSLLGGTFLLWMGGGMLLDAVRGRLTLSMEPGTSTSRLGPVLRGAVVSLSNPYWIIWWAVVGLKLASDALAIGPLAVGAFFVGHELADFGWYGIVIGLVATGRRFVSDRVYRVVIGVCATALLYIGLTFVWTGLQGRIGL